VSEVVVQALHAREAPIADRAAQRAAAAHLLALAGAGSLDALAAAAEAAAEAEAAAAAARGARAADGQDSAAAAAAASGHANAPPGPVDGCAPRSQPAPDRVGGVWRHAAMRTCCDKTLKP
jgi:hypothetical protein